MSGARHDEDQLRVRDPIDDCALPLIIGELNARRSQMRRLIFGFSDGDERPQGVEMVSQTRLEREVEQGPVGELVLQFLVVRE